MKKYLLIAMIPLFAILSCSKNKTEPPPKKLTVAVIPKGATQVFWKSVHAGAGKAAREWDIDLIWKGPIKEDDRESQIQVVEDFITRKVSGIVLAPLDDTALRIPVQNAVRSDIPVVIIDSDLKSQDYTSFVATDNLAAGKQAGRCLAQLIGQKGNLVMLRNMEGSASTTNREEGFLQAIGECPDIKILSANQYGGATSESAFKTSENLLAPYRTPDGRLAIDGIFCPNELTTFGMLRALQESGHAGKVKFVGFDSSDKLVQALADDQIHGLVLQNPFQMGYLGVNTLVRHLRGEPVDKRIDTGSTIVTKQNMNQPGIKDLLQPDFSKWLNE